jgi:hypothetical protein
MRRNPRRIRLSLEQLECRITPVAGLVGNYFDTATLQNLVTTRVDPVINFSEAEWGNAPAGTAVTPDDSYSERWTGFVRTETAGNWTFYTTSNDGVRLWIDENLIIDNWTQHTVTEDQATVNLSAGWHAIRLEHYQQNGTVAISLSFAGPGQSKTIIPSTHLNTENPEVQPPPPPQPGPVSVTGDMLTWHRTTVTFTGPQTSESAAVNPFRDYRLNVTFTSPTGKTTVVPGFFAADGNAANTSATAGDKWRVHFTPDEAGTWTYTASFRTGTDVAISLNPNAGTATGFNGTTGQFTIAASNPNSGNPIDRGMVRYVGGHHLQYAGSGEYYLKAGADSPENFLAYWEFDNTFDTGGLATPGLINGLHRYGNHVSDWQNGDPTWQNGKGKGIIGALNYLASEGMNSVYFLTYNLDGGDGADTWMWTGTNERFRFDVSKLDQWEIVFNHMSRLGIQLHVVLSETENDMGMDNGTLGAVRSLYYRELVARFSHHQNVIWNIGEENDNSDPQRKGFANYIRSLDPYDHPITVHTDFNDVIGTYDGLVGDPNFEATSIQGNGSNYNMWAIQVRNLSANAGRPWAVYGDEQGPAVKADLSNLTQLRRDTLWGNLMGGGAGVEWYFGYQGSFGDVQSEDWRIVDPLWNTTRHAVEFFQTYLPFERMNPDNGLTANTNDYVHAVPGEVYAVYLKTGGTTTLNLQSFAGTYAVEWYNPRTGGGLQVGSVPTITGSGLVGIGSPPSDTGNDWVALIRRTVSPGLPPAAPSGLSAVAVSSSQINLAWADNANNETSYIVQRATNAGFTQNLATSTLGANATGFQATGLWAQTQYFFRVQAVNANGASAYTNVASATTQAGTTTSAVIAFVLVNADTDQDIGELVNGQTINLAALGTMNLNIRAVVTGTVESVRMQLDGSAIDRTENNGPYALAGNNGSNYSAWTPSAGTHTLTATPFSLDNLGGVMGTAFTIQFTVL